MGRPLRIDTPGTIHHVYNRGNNRHAIFSEPRDYEQFLKFVAECKLRMKFEVHAYCLIPNHFHMLIRSAETHISKFMGRILEQYARYWNWKRQTSGRVFESRFKSKIFSDNPSYFSVFRYVHRNPIKHGLVQRIEDWRWSGHNALRLGIQDQIIDAKFPLSLFANETNTARSRYENFISMDPNPIIEELPKIEFLNEDDSIAEQNLLPREISVNPGTGINKSLGEIALEIEETSGISFQNLRRPMRRASMKIARRKFVLEAIDNNYLLTEIAEFLGRNRSSISRMQYE